MAVFTSPVLRRAEFPINFIGLCLFFLLVFLQSAAWGTGKPLTEISPLSQSADTRHGAKPNTLIAYFRHRPPYMIYENNAPSGPLIDLLEIIAGKMNLKVDWLYRPVTESLDTLKSGEADVALRLSKTKEREEYLHFLGPIEEENKTELFLVLSKQSPFSMRHAEMQRLVEEMRNHGEIDALFAKHDKNRILMTPEERAYIGRKGSIKNCTLIDSLPYERINEKGNHEGIGAEILGLLQKRLGVRFEHHPIQEWSDALNAIRVRQCDILSIANDIPSRHDSMNFTKPYMVLPIVIATHAKEFFVRDGSEIGDRKIGIIKGYSILELLQKHYPNMQTVDVQNAKDGLERVHNGELWGYVDVVPSISFVLQKYSMLDLKIAGKIEFDLELSIASRNDEPLLASIMQKAADSISEEERRSIVGKWISVRFEQGFDYSLFWKFAIGVVLLLLVFYLWNRKLAKLNSEIKAKNLVIEKQHQIVIKSLEQIATLLNNSGQGFLSFNRDLLVDKAYSRECVHIFNRDTLDLPLPDLLCPKDTQQREFIAKTLRLIMEDGVDSLRRDAYIGLLPSEYRLGKNDYKAEYRLLESGRIMLILTNVTGEKHLKVHLALERSRLEFVVNALENRDDLLEIVHDYEAFRSRTLPDLLSFERQPRALLAEIFRQIHTFKSLFFQVSLPTIPEVLHELESRLGHLRDRDTGFDINDIKLELGATDLGAALEQDLLLLREKLGDDYFSSEREVRVPISRLASLEAEARILHGDDSHLFDLIRRLRYVPLKSLIEPHFKTAEKLAKRQEKLVAPISYTGNTALVDPEIFGSFCKALVHLFRNSVDHGIEDVDTRIMVNKDEMATIFCHVLTSSDHLKLSIGDDGRGIDVALIRAMAVERRHIDADVAAAMRDKEAMRLIFDDGLSTCNEVSATSGRGVGLSAVQQELVRLGGSVSIDSVIGEGTRFNFILPYQPPPATAKATIHSHVKQLLAPLPSVLQAFCEEHLKLPVTLDETLREFTAGSLCDFTALVSLGSGLNARIGLSIERSLLLTMTQRFEPDFPASEIDELSDSVGAEILNTLIGNATVYFTHLARNVEMGTPTIISPAERATILGPHVLPGFAGHCDAGKFIVFSFLTENEPA
ncbi:hypothetical protein CCP4SC76_2280017 [Gammaproteobacteria bacterium]